MAGKLSADDKAALLNGALRKMRAALDTPLDVVNLATFMHRVSRAVGHSGVASVCDNVQYEDVMQVGWGCGRWGEVCGCSNLLFELGAR